LKFLGRATYSRLASLSLLLLRAGLLLLLVVGFVADAAIAVFVL